MATNFSLLGSTSRIETPFIKVTFGDKANGYTFGVFQRTKAKQKDANGFYTSLKTVYPNYIQSLEIIKINGQVNQYTLSISYPVKNGDDPNFFEKVFSSVSQTRKIVFTYGDVSLPTYIYKNEEAIITKIQTNFKIESSVIDYTISAISSARLAQSASYPFINTSPKKPSDEIKALLYNKNYGLQEIFYGMNNKALVESSGLIPGDDRAVRLESFENITPLDYLKYLVSCMQPGSGNVKNPTVKDIYTLLINDDTSGKFGGPYFEIKPLSKKVAQSDAYSIDIGYPTANIVTSFQIENNENYSIFYDWQGKLNDAEYTYRINDDGVLEETFAPVITSNNETRATRISDQTWWTKLTEFPISVNITIKGLLRPAILMSAVRLNVYFFGQKHISSGLYVVTKQVDRVDTNGYRTALSMTRVGGDN